MIPSFEDKQFMIFNVSEVDKIDFTQVIEESIDTLRKSINGKKTFVKWHGDMPQCLLSLITKEGPYTHEGMLTILSKPQWTKKHINQQTQ
jgi:hypothetical protein